MSPSQPPSSPPLEGLLLPLWELNPLVPLPHILPYWMPGMPWPGACFF